MDTSLPHGLILIWWSSSPCRTWPCIHCRGFRSLRSWLWHCWESRTWRCAVLILRPFPRTWFCSCSRLPCNGLGLWYTDHILCSRVSQSVTVWCRRHHYFWRWSILCCFHWLLLIRPVIFRGRFRGGSPRVTRAALSGKIFTSHYSFPHRADDVTSPPFPASCCWTGRAYGELGTR